MRRWAVGYMVTALLLGLASFVLPQYHLVLWGLFGWTATAAVIVGVVRNRPSRRMPWFLVAAALGVFVTGDMVYDVLTQVLHHRNPFPSAADVFFFATYPLFTGGLLGLVRARNPERKLGPLLDVLIVTTSASVFIMEPYTRAVHMPLIEKIVSISYPLGDVALLCVLSMLILAVGLRNWSVRLLTVGAIGLLVSDIFYGGNQLNGTWQQAGLINVGWVLFYLCWAAAALHPSMRELTEPQPPREIRLSVRTLVVLSAATLVAPGLLVWRAATDGTTGDIGVIGVASGLVFLLVIARLTNLVRTQSAQADRERGLRRDVAEGKLLEEQLRHQASHDNLTNLTTRNAFNERVELALSRRSQLHTGVAVMLLDIDDFKAVNDTLGHPAGDEVLVQFAARLLGCLRGEDLAARLGGDEFAVCIEVGTGHPGVPATAQRILDAMLQRFTVAATEIDAHVTIGISVADDTTEGPLDMLRKADVALYAAKNTDKGSMRFFDDRLRDRSPSTRDRRSTLNRARPSTSRRAAGAALNMTTVATTSAVRADQVRLDPRWADLERLRSSHPMMDATIEEIRGRRIRIGDRWLSDFASCNYLGFDLDEEIIDSVDGALRRWGTHPSWSRLLGNPRLYNDIEDQLSELLGAPDTMVLPTITHIHTAIIPLLAGHGWVFVDSRAHKTIHDGAAIAAGQGAVLRRFRSHDGCDVSDLQRQLEEAPAGATKLVCMDGVNSMTGNLPDLAAFAQVTRAHEALLYIDDAHGFGLVGERSEQEATPYGQRGNSIVRHTGQTYDNIILVGGFSKSYSSLLAFLTVPTWLKNHLKVAAAPYLYSGPSPTASLATVLAGMHVNAARGDSIRTDLYRKTTQVLDTVRGLGIVTPNRSGLPVIEVPLHRAADIDGVGHFLFDREIYVTLAAYPLVPRSEVGFRIQITAANSDHEIDQLCDVLAELSERFELKHPSEWSGLTSPAALT